MKHLMILKVSGNTLDFIDCIIMVNGLISHYYGFMLYLRKLHCVYIMHNAYCIIYIAECILYTYCVILYTKVTISYISITRIYGRPT